MATYAGVKLAEEPHLRKIIEGMVVAPLPPGWTEDEDTAGGGEGEQGQGQGQGCAEKRGYWTMLLSLCVVEFDAKFYEQPQFCLTSSEQQRRSCHPAGQFYRRTTLREEPHDVIDTQFPRWFPIQLNSKTLFSRHRPIGFIRVFAC